MGCVLLFLCCSCFTFWMGNRFQLIILSKVKQWWARTERPAFCSWVDALPLKLTASQCYPNKKEKHPPPCLFSSRLDPIHSESLRWTLDMLSSSTNLGLWEEEFYQDYNSQEKTETHTVEELFPADGKLELPAPSQRTPVTKGLLEERPTVTHKKSWDNRHQEEEHCHSVKAKEGNHHAFIHTVFPSPELMAEWGRAEWQWLCPALLCAPGTMELSLHLDQEDRSFMTISQSFSSKSPEQMKARSYVCVEGTTA